MLICLPWLNEDEKQAEKYLLHHFWLCSNMNVSAVVLNLCSCGSQGELATDHDVVDFIMNQPNVVPRINPRVLSTSRAYLDLSDTSEYTESM